MMDIESCPHRPDVYCEDCEPVEAWVHRTLSHSLLLLRETLADQGQHPGKPSQVSSDWFRWGLWVRR